MVFDSWFIFQVFFIMIFTLYRHIRLLFIVFLFLANMPGILYHNIHSDCIRLLVILFLFLANMPDILYHNIHSRWRHLAKRHGIWFLVHMPGILTIIFTLDRDIQLLVIVFLFLANMPGILYHNIHSRWRHLANRRGIRFLVHMPGIFIIIFTLYRHIRLLVIVFLS